MIVPNRQHNSGKPLKGKSTCKGRVRASKQSRRALLLKLKKAG